MSVVQVDCVRGQCGIWKRARILFKSHLLGDPMGTIQRFHHRASDFSLVEIEPLFEILGWFRNSFPVYRGKRSPNRGLSESGGQSPEASGPYEARNEAAKLVISRKPCVLPRYRERDEQPKQFKRAQAEDFKHCRQLCGGQPDCPSVFPAQNENHRRGAAYPSSGTSKQPVTKEQYREYLKSDHYMNLIEFPEVTTVIAKDQPQYNPLPAHRFQDAEGRIACCWKLTWPERLKLLWRGVIWHQILTFNQPLQPQLLTVEKPDMKTYGRNA